MLSVKAYEVRDGTLLSFPKNVVIALSSKPVDKGVFYCCVYLIVYSCSCVCLSSFMHVTPSHRSRFLTYYDYAYSVSLTISLYTHILSISLALSHAHSSWVGWLHGTYEGRTGAFPAAYVSAILGEPTPNAIDQARLQV